MENSTTVLDLDFGMSQLSGNKKLLFTLLEKFSEEYRSTEAKLQSMVEQNEFNEAYSLVHTLKGVTGNLGLFALHNASKPVESCFRNEQRLSDDYESFLSTLNETLAAVDALTGGASSDSEQASEPQNDGAAAQQAKKQLLAALKASEFISQEKLDGWIDSIGLANPKRSAIIDAVDELDYEAAIAELESI